MSSPSADSFSAISFFVPDVRRMMFGRMYKNLEPPLIQTTTGLVPGEIASILCSEHLVVEIEEEKTCLTRTTAAKNPTTLTPKRKCARLSNVASRKSKLLLKRDVRWIPLKRPQEICAKRMLPARERRPGRSRGRSRWPRQRPT